VNGHLRVLATLHVGGRGPAHHVRGWVPPKTTWRLWGRKSFWPPLDIKSWFSCSP